MAAAVEAQCGITVTRGARRGGGGLILPTGARYSFGPSFFDNSVVHAGAIVAAYAGGLLSLAFALLCVGDDGLP